jgi:hypothetical protein
MVWEGVIPLFPMESSITKETEMLVSAQDPEFTNLL